MKVVMLSLRPQWCEKIFNGEKTIEVRKTRPLIDMPFKVYVYQTKITFKVRNWQENFQSIVFTPNGGAEDGNGKVIGEFICDKIDCYPYGDMAFPTPAYDGDPTCCECGNGYYITCGELEKTCLEYKDLENYGKSKTLYGWHISDLKIYDKPKELSEFRKVCLNGKCSDCIYEECKITRPPQSWCYVEELQ